VQRICHSAGTTAVLVTHDQDEALSMADRVAVLRDGRIVQYAAPQELYTRPADPALARFIGDANLLEGHVADAKSVDTILGRLTLESPDAVGAASGPVMVLVRPEQLEILGQPAAENAPAAAGGPGADCLSGHVIACEYYGHDAVVRVRPDTEPGVQDVIVRTSGGPQLPAGSPVLVRARGPVIAWAR
jgi:iron(III) transport system ATP-binding protein